jgi:hypothetical protein
MDSVGLLQQRRASYEQNHVDRQVASRTEKVKHELGNDGHVPVGDRRENSARRNARLATGAQARQVPLAHRVRLRVGGDARDEIHVDSDGQESFRECEVRTIEIDGVAYHVKITASCVAFLCGSVEKLKSENERLRKLAREGHVFELPFCMATACEWNSSGGGTAEQHAAHIEELLNGSAK